MGEPGAEGIWAELTSDVAEQLARRYRVDSTQAAIMISENWRKQPRLVAAVSEATSAAEVRRLRVYRTAVAAVKRDTYQRLRRYRAEPAAFDDALAALSALEPGTSGDELAGRLEAVAAAHVSTEERLPHWDQFLAVLLAALDGEETGPGGRTVVDVGCGVLPLLLPVPELASRGVTGYWALDKDEHAEAALRAYAALRADAWLRPAVWNVTDGWGPLLEAGLPADCDVGLLLKVVPVVARQSPDLLPVLAGAPAGRLLISGSRIAMAKRQDIERRERRVVQRFCADHGLAEVGDYRTDDEFFLLTERR